MKKETGITVHSDTAGVAKLMRLPTAILEGRFAEVAAVPGARDDFGPADKRLFVVARIAESDWPAWEKALSEPAAPGTYYLSENMAAKLLPADWVESMVPDEHGRGLRLDGPAYLPDSLATSWYAGVAAVKWRDWLFMEFSSR